MRCHVGKREFRHARLALAQKFARAAQLEIAFGDDKPVIRLPHDSQTRRCGVGERCLVQQQAG